MPGTDLDPDLRRILDVVSAAEERPRPPGRLADDVLRRLADLIACDAVSFSDFDFASCTIHLDQTCESQEVETETCIGAVPDDPFFVHYWQTLSCSYPSRSGDDRSVIARSDFYSDREWLRTPMYLECFRPLGLRDSLLTCLPTRGTRTRRVIFFRAGSSGFDDRDRLLLSLLRPHLVEAFAAGCAPTPAAALTSRQQELLRLVAKGHTNIEIANLLCVSAHTVRKHLENVFERLGVSTRTAAVARAFPQSEETGVP